MKIKDYNLMVLEINNYINLFNNQQLMNQTMQAIFPNRLILAVKIINYNNLKKLIQYLIQNPNKNKFVSIRRWPQFNN